MVQSYLERYGRQPAFPTPAHLAATEAVVDYFALDPRVQAVLLVNSCARGVAVAASCVDIVVLVAPGDLRTFSLTERSRADEFVATDPACQRLAHAVPWSAVDLAFTSGEFPVPEHGWTSGADAYELEIGNVLAWAHPLLLRGHRYEELQAQYLPYYDEALRVERLPMVVRFAANNIAHVAPYAQRGLYEQSLKRLYHATEEYLQAFFIQRRTYPIAYNKWLREQLADVLNAPALYEELLSILAFSAFTVPRFREHARRLQALLDQLD